MNQSVATIRSLVIDTINNANSGHPGMALGSAPALYQLFNHNLITTPENSGWINRDRFVLASGHASALLYSILHLSGFNISIDDLKQFRQWNSVTPGHPEYKVTHGVDASSGPLGQGVPTAVGMALAEKLMSKNYPSLINHYTYALWLLLIRFLLQCSFYTTVLLLEKMGQHISQLNRLMAYV